jgi:hypothetical protein
LELEPDVPGLVPYALELPDVDGVLAVFPEPEVPLPVCPDPYVLPVAALPDVEPVVPVAEPLVPLVSVETLPLAEGALGCSVEVLDDGLPVCAEARPPCGCDDDVCCDFSCAHPASASATATAVARCLMFSPSEKAYALKSGDRRRRGRGSPTAAISVKSAPDARGASTAGGRPTHDLRPERRQGLRAQEALRGRRRRLPTGAAVRPHRP